MVTTVDTICRDEMKKALIVTSITEHSTSTDLMDALQSIVGGFTLGTSLSISSVERYGMFTVSCFCCYI